MMVLKLGTPITCFDPSNIHHLVVHLASSDYTLWIKTLFDDEISIILIHSKSCKLIQLCTV